MIRVAIGSIPLYIQCIDTVLLLCLSFCRLGLPYRPRCLFFCNLSLFYRLLRCRIILRWSLFRSTFLSYLRGCCLLLFHTTCWSVAIPHAMFPISYLPQRRIQLFLARLPARQIRPWRLCYPASALRLMFLFVYQRSN